MVLERLAATGEIPEIRTVQAACKRRLSGTPAPGEPTGRCRVRALGRSRGKTEPSTGYFAAPLPFAPPRRPFPEDKTHKRGIRPDLLLSASTTVKVPLLVKLPASVKPDVDDACR